MSIQQRAIITRVLKGRFYEIALQDTPEHTALVVICGRMRVRRISLEPGDEVSVELSPYDLERGRITWRHD
jgi:translation initiation factor IF-1